MFRQGEDMAWQLRVFVGQRAPRCWMSGKRQLKVQLLFAQAACALHVGCPECVLLCCCCAYRVCVQRTNPHSLTPMQCGILPYAGVDICLFELLKDRMLER